MSLQAFLTENGIVHFTATEINPVGKLANGKGPALEAAPMPLWGNAIKTLKVAEWLRAQWGESIEVLSGYRDPEYNEAVGGEDKSLHMLFNALDIRMKTRTPKEIALRLEKHPDSKKMGLGIYKGFVHMDTRGLLGLTAPARWHG
jgi:hypothetical protein